MGRKWGGRSNEGLLENGRIEREMGVGKLTCDDRPG